MIIEVGPKLFEFLITALYVVITHMIMDFVQLLIIQNRLPWPWPQREDPNLAR